MASRTNSKAAAPRSPRPSRSILAALPALPAAPLRDKRYRCYPIRFAMAVLIAAPIVLGMLVRKHQPIPLDRMRRSSDGRWGLVSPSEQWALGEISYGLQLDPIEAPADCLGIDLQMGDLVIDPIDGRYCHLLYFRVMATRTSYQIDVRLIPLDTLPLDLCELITCDLSYQTEIGNIISATKILKHASTDRVFAIDCTPPDFDPLHIMIRHGREIDPRIVAATLYEPLELSVGDRVTWDNSGVLGEIISFRLEEDIHGFYRVMVAVTHLICEQDQLRLSVDPEAVGWFPYCQINKFQ